MLITLGIRGLKYNWFGNYGVQHVLLRRYPTWFSSFCLLYSAVAVSWSIPDKSVCSKNRSSFIAASYFKRLNDLGEYSLITAPTYLFGFNYDSAVAVDAPRTYSFLNFSAIAAPSSRIAAFNIVVGAWAGKWLHFGGCSDNVTLSVLFAALVGLPFYQYQRTFLVHLF